MNSWDDPQTQATLLETARHENKVLSRTVEILVQELREVNEKNSERVQDLEHERQILLDVIDQAAETGHDEHAKYNRMHRRAQRAEGDCMRIQFQHDGLLRDMTRRMDYYRDKCERMEEEQAVPWYTRAWRWL